MAMGRNHLISFLFFQTRIEHWMCWICQKLSKCWISLDVTQVPKVISATIWGCCRVFPHIRPVLGWTLVPCPSNSIGKTYNFVSRFRDTARFRLRDKLRDDCVTSPTVDFMDVTHFALSDHPWVSRAATTGYSTWQWYQTNSYVRLGPLRFDWHR